MGKISSFLGALVFLATSAHAVETFHCEGMAVEQGCGYGLAVQLGSPTRLDYIDLRVRCADQPDDVRILVQSGGVFATPNFRPRYDSRYFGWTQFVVEGLSNGQRAILLVAPRNEGAPLAADLRLAVPGAPANAVMELSCSGH